MGIRTKRLGLFFIAGLFVLVSEVHSQNIQALRLIQTIPLQGVGGRIDHMAIDLDRRRLFVAALGSNSLEVVDLQAGKPVRSIGGLREPQGVLYIHEFNRIFVTSGGNGSCNAFDGNSFRIITTIKFSSDADNIRYDQATKRIYVGFGTGALGIFDARDGKQVDDIRLAGHPESFQLEDSGPRIFVNIPTANHVAVVDRDKQLVITTWPLNTWWGNFPMALDENGHRLFVGCRKPPGILICDTQTGRIITTLGISGDVDDIFYDVESKLIYASCGEGFLEVFQQRNKDQFAEVAKLPTAGGARTSLFIPEQNRLYLAVPQHGNQEAAVQVYEVGEAEEPSEGTD